MTEISPDVHEALNALAEALATAVAPLAAKVEQARDIAADLEAELAVCRAHLRRLVPLCATTWSADTDAVDEAVAYLEGDDDAPAAT